MDIEMRPAVVYCSQPPSNRVEKEAVIHEQLDGVLATLTNVERHTVVPFKAGERKVACTVPGLTQVRPGEAIIALGRAAHNILADVRKRTLMAGGSRLEDDDSEEIEQLVWSCVNTLELVALGRRAWQSAQLLPVQHRCFFSVPPLRMGPATGVGPNHRVLVINHNDDDSKARALIEALDRSGFEVASASSGLETMAQEDCWRDQSFVHVHVGEHALDADEPRLVDSWWSDRLALQLISRRRIPGTGHSQVLMIEDEANGFICETPEAIVATCGEVLADRVLQRKLIAAGQNSVAPLVRNWVTIAEALLT